MKRDVKLYNVMFPIWFLLIYPTYLWMFILPANFAIDSLVLILALKFLKIDEKFKIWESAIFKIFGVGFLSDFIGAAITYPVTMMMSSDNFNPTYFPAATIVTIPGVILAGVLIYFLNKKLSFRKTQLTPKQIHSISLALAVFTAPYAMMIPIYV